MNDDRCCSGSGGVLLAFLAGGLAGDLKKKTDEWTGEVKQKVEGFIDEERSVIKAAYDAGREAMAREKARFENPTPE